MLVPPRPPRKERGPLDDALGASLKTIMTELTNALMTAVWFLLGAGTTAVYYFSVRPCLDMDEAQLRRLDTGLALLSVLGLVAALMALR